MQDVKANIGGTRACHCALYGRACGYVMSDSDDWCKESHCTWRMQCSVVGAAAL